MITCVCGGGWGGDFELVQTPSCALSVDEPRRACWWLRVIRECMVLEPVDVTLR